MVLSLFYDYYITVITIIIIRYTTINNRDISITSKGISYMSISFLNSNSNSNNDGIVMMIGSSSPQSFENLKPFLSKLSFSNSNDDDNDNNDDDNKNVILLGPPAAISFITLGSRYHYHYHYHNVYYYYQFMTRLIKLCSLS